MRREAVLAPDRAVWVLSDAVGGAGWLYLTWAVGFGLILTYAGFRAPPIVRGEQ